MAEVAVPRQISKGILSLPLEVNFFPSVNHVTHLDRFVELFLPNGGEWAVLWECRSSPSEKW
jgi:hypothetical protein